MMTKIPKTPVLGKESQVCTYLNNLFRYFDFQRVLYKTSVSGHDVTFGLDLRRILECPKLFETHKRLSMAMTTVITHYWC